MNEMFVATAQLELPSKKTGDPDPKSVEVMRTAEKVFDDPTGLLAVYNNGAQTIRVDHRLDRGVSLEVTAQRASRIHYGVSLLFAHLIVKDQSGAMSLTVERRKLKSYNLSDDPFVDLILSHFASHLSK